MDNKIPVQADGTLLTTPIPRPNHIILHDHVFVGKKLGNGAFGVCHAGVLKIGEMTHDVAIKKFKGMMHKKDRMEFVKVCLKVTNHIHGFLGIQCHAKFQAQERGEGLWNSDARGTDNAHFGTMLGRLSKVLSQEQS